MSSVGALIWISCRPLLRLMITATCGFVITRLDIFPAVAARGAGQIILNIALPCLMFSKIVPAFTSDNVSALGPLVVVAVLYEIIGVLIAWIVKQFFWVPHRFRYGILVAGGWGNVGDIPTAVVMSLAANTPFNGTEDQNLAVAYLSAFVLVFMITLFPLGFHKWISMDYVGPDVENEDIREAIRIKRKVILCTIPRVVQRLVQRHQLQPDPQVHDTEKAVISNTENFSRVESSALEKQPTLEVGKHVSFLDDAATAVPTEAGLPSRSPSFERASDVGRPETSSHQNIKPTGIRSTTTNESTPHPLASPEPSCATSRRKSILPLFRTFVKSVLTPPSIAIFLSFPIALISPLKALFVQVPGSHIPPAPDGLPPLSFLLDATTFIGGASVPLGLISLGSAIARMDVPRNQWRTLPLGAISGLAIGKMVIVPILGVLVCEKIFVPVGLISKDDKVLRFVCVFLSCLPTATTQVFLTQVYSGTGGAEHLSAFLIPQYFLMFISMTALTAYTIQLIF